MKRGEIWWVDLPDPSGSELAGRRPVLIIQANAFTQSRIATVIVAGITSNVHLASAPGNVFLKKTRTGLKRDSVVNVSQLASVSKSQLSESCGKVSDEQQKLVDAGLRRILSLPQV